LKLVQGSVGRLLRMSFIQSNCGCLARKLLASKGFPQAAPQRALKPMALAIFVSSTFASKVPAGP